MSTNYFNMNRAVHLARRDLSYDKAVELLQGKQEELETDQWLQHIKQVLKLMETSKKHAYFASHSQDSKELEQDFLHFVDLLADNISAIQVMLEHQIHLEEEESFLCHFLGAKPEDLTLSALHYKRRADDIYQGLCQFLELSQKPYESLKKRNLKRLSQEDKERYKKAMESLETTFGDSG